jgi:hypothetical protein
VSIRGIALLGAIVGYGAAAWQFHGALLVVATDALRVGALSGLALWIGGAGITRFLALEIDPPDSKAAKDETRRAA